MNRRTICALLCAMTPVLAHANIYAYTGSNGVIHLTNLPGSNHKYKLVMHTVPAPAFNAYAPPPVVVPPSTLSPILYKYASKYHVNPALVKAVIMAESGFRSNALSDKGAMGLMQLMPATAQRMGVVNPYDPQQNIKGGTKYLSELLHFFNNNVRLAVAAYNAGKNAVIQANYHVPDFTQTQNYVPEVLRYYSLYQSQ